MPLPHSSDIPTNEVPAHDVVLASANDNTDPNTQRRHVRQIDLGSGSAQAISDLLRGYDERCLSGYRLIHGSRQVARLLFQNASQEARESFAEFAFGALDVLIVRDLVAISPNLEPTPNDREPSAQARILALSNAGLALACGQLPVAVSNENHGRYDRHVRPTTGLAHVKSSTGGAELGPLTEHSFRNHGNHGQVSPQLDSICLVGVRNDGAEPTGFAALGDVLPHIPAESIAALHQPVFGMDPPDSSEARGTVWNVPILYRRHGRVECAYRSDKVHAPDNIEGRRALQDLNSAIAKAARSVVLLPGTAWLARNPRCFHWRDNVRDNGRWLVRGFGLAPYSPAVFPDHDRPDLIQY
jgi:hypothetical protein